MTRERRRVLLVEFARPDPAAVALGRLLRDEGVEVVHAGPLATEEQILRTAEQEDPDAVGVLGDAPSAELEAALSDFAVFTTPEEAVEWLPGGRSHTSGTPSDRAR
ncbi:hypothetical protein MUY14_32815 [Amycolatopsis sp. FBCC-B4732]|uniref:hypothetical protein n=1 Tax=Amycolatopsis sp. FBCC-B4732 TaxID=3079339 RepID=UPI001FF64F21|nr:hypothetical protein [Amycolatopsis sp. FBCC-B4732]UOX86506.1 hypothetical protein MUY14_32815 [Amycolatopsis sp. FBCC-B4732]